MIQINRCSLTQAHLTKRSKVCGVCPAFHGETPVAQLHFVGSPSYPLGTVLHIRGRTCTGEKARFEPAAGRRGHGWQVDVRGGRRESRIMLAQSALLALAVLRR